ncbi:hypothetical protein BKP45_00850 [Anaerobacillus alkalidiazotrophicus]|uniref:Uncharacterized protein n=1 Tax=Anaerobacillus alkalidiazotrophicus TaxID=472963 RepID=A0A1S2M9K6_9BACI|nr:hypothetical protein BKP45_00850 [Anaerobacillus alkalidiazotrophicus]
MNRSFIKSIDSFQVFMLGEGVPCYVQRYCKQLDASQWQWFYEQMLEPVTFVTDTAYLFYVLKWILKYDFDDLSYAVYFQDIMDPECNPQSLIKDEWLPVLWNRYGQRLKKELFGIRCSLNDESVTDVIGDDAAIF